MLTPDTHGPVVQVGEVMVGPGTGMAMSDHDIHGTEVVGKEPSVSLALYGYALTRFPSVAWYHPAFGTVRTSAWSGPTPGRTWRSCSPMTK